MPSRKSPSQRDPLTRLSQAIRAGSPASMGGRVANASSVKPTTTPNRRNVGVGGGDSAHDGTGANSTQVGTSATATGDNTTAVGDGADAQTDRGTALGRNTTVWGGTHGTAVGYGAEAQGDYGTAMGDTTNAIGVRTLAVGYQAYAHAGDATAVGAQSEAAGDGSVAIGSGATVGGDRGVAVGNSSSTDADSIAIGDRAEGGAGGNVVLGPVARATSTAATTGGCVIVGAGATSSAPRAVAIGNAAHVTTANTGKIKVDTLEVESSSAAGAQTAVILTDSASTRWLIGVDTSGNPIGLGAA